MSSTAWESFLQCSGKLIQHHQHILLSFKEEVTVSNITDMYPLAAVNSSNGDNGGEHAHKDDSAQKEVGSASKCHRK